MLDEKIERLREEFRGLGLDEKISDAIVVLIRAHAKPTAIVDLGVPSANSPTTIGDISRVFLRQSLRRSQVLGLNVDDPSWNMLLALIVDQSRDTVSSVSSLCHASGAPPTTALRHLTGLERAGLIKRRDDPKDARRILISPTYRTEEAMKEMIRSFCIPAPNNSRPLRRAR